MEGKAFGQYRLLGLLGRGGMGEVWRAYDTVTDRVVALKVLHAHLSHDDSFQQRFRREAHAATRLNNRHVVPIHTHGEINGKLFLDMRLIDGIDLEAVLANGPLDPARAVSIVDQVGKALHAAHQVGLVHRDVKPSNVLLEGDDFAYLIDFGIARAAAEVGVTGTDHVIGTYAYMAPERFTTPVTDARSDVYALACVLHECLTGSRPFPGDSPEVQFGQHMSAPPPRPSRVRPNLPGGFDAVIAGGMAKDPERRFQSALDLAEAARKVASALPPPSAPDPEATRVSRSAAGPTMPSPPAQNIVSPSAQTQQRSPGQFASRRPQESDISTPGSSSSLWRRKKVLVPTSVIGLVAVSAVLLTVIVERSPSLVGEPAGLLGIEMDIYPPDPSGDTASDTSAAPDLRFLSDPIVVSVRPSVIKVNAAAPDCKKTSVWGSGFVVAPNRVMSNAHVVAGSESVSVEAEGKAYDAIVVSYDSSADVAILDVPGLPSAPLQFDMQEAQTGTDTLSLGYGNGGAFDATPTRIREIIQLNGPDYYHQTTVSRDVYAFRGDLPQGNSGGPLVDRDGKVLGMVFGSIRNYPHTGLALTSSQLSLRLEKIGNAAEESTGACI